MEKHFFTIAEARELLPTLKGLVGQVVHINRKLEEQREVVERFAEASANDSGGPEGTAYLKGLAVMRNCLDQIQETGCMIKSLEDGLIDFSHLKDGREVYLCWRHGEEDILFWHEVDEGFPGRIPIVEE
jgi:hypothetical protein